MWSDYCRRLEERFFVRGGGGGRSRRGPALRERVPHDKGECFHPRTFGLAGRYTCEREAGRARNRCGITRFSSCIGHREEDGRTTRVCVVVLDASRAVNAASLRRRQQQYYAPSCVSDASTSRLLKICNLRATPKRNVIIYISNVFVIALREIVSNQYLLLVPPLRFSLHRQHTLRSSHHCLTRVGHTSSSTPILPSPSVFNHVARSSSTMGSYMRIFRTSSAFSDREWADSW